MPNYVQIRIKYDEDSEDWKANKIKFDEMLAFMESKESKFDFNNLIPMPDELKGTVSPSRVVKDEDYEAVHASEVERAKKYPYSEMGFSISESRQKYLFDTYGTDNWYDWRVSNWDTKWNAGSVETDGDCIMFQTAWAFPELVIEALSKKFPDLLLKIDYADEDYGRNCGITEWLDGEMTSSDIEDGRSEDSKWDYFAELLHAKGDIMRLCRERFELNEQIKMMKAVYEPWRID